MSFKWISKPYTKITSMEHPYIKSNRANVVKPVGREESRGGVFKAQSKSKNEAAAKPAKRHSFCNWAGNQRSNSAQIFHPNTANDLVEIVNKAKAESENPLHGYRSHVVFILYS